MHDDPETRPSPERTRATSAAAAPDLNATGSGAPLSAAEGEASDRDRRSREAQEREAAWRRGRERRASGAGGHARTPLGGDSELARRAFVALAENVRDYAIFLMDADGIIRYWGEGAHLLKRWTREETEGAHLRLLYPDGGSEDGTAEDHLRDAAAHGESVSQGHRVRGDGTLFWAHITLTALKDEDGTLLGFTKVTRDVTAQHLADTARALAEKVSELGAAREERASLLAELEVLKEELGVLREELQSRGDRPDRRPGGPG